MTIRIDPDGTVQFIYSDQLRPLLEMGEAKIRRASHVEPTPDGRWQADLNPIGGPLLPPTDSREASLRREAQWITLRYLNVPAELT